jgi:hypothetical protein
MNKNIILGAIAALTIASASAENIYISGATAYRGTANDAIKEFVASRGGSITTSNNASLGSATLLKANFTNAVGTHYIYVRWTGSEGGIQSCASPRTGSNAVTVNFYNDDVTNGLVGASTNNAKVTDIAFSDTYQSTSLFRGGKKFNGVTYTTLTGFNNSADGICGVNQFVWITGSNCPISNITSMQARNLLANGTMPTAQFTGNRAHDGTGVYLIGRNSDSGTRLSVQGEVGFGANEKPQQYLVTSKSAISLWIPETINGLSLDDGQSGYDSGGTMAKVFTEAAKYPLNDNVTGDDTYGANYIIGYMGVGDAINKNTLLPDVNIKLLTFNGVACTIDNIKNGQYSLWTWEHLYYNPSATALAKSVANAIGAKCLTVDSVVNGAIKYDDQSAVSKRDGDAAPVYTLY